jgi:hypothetical protein
VDVEAGNLSCMTSIHPSAPYQCRRRGDLTKMNSTNPCAGSAATPWLQWG